MRARARQPSFRTDDCVYPHRLSDGSSATRCVHERSHEAAGMPSGAKGSNAVDLTERNQQLEGEARLRRNILKWEIESWAPCARMRRRRRSSERTRTREETRSKQSRAPPNATMPDRSVLHRGEPASRMTGVVPPFPLGHDGGRRGEFFRAPQVGPLFTLRKPCGTNVSNRPSDPPRVR